MLPFSLSTLAGCYLVGILISVDVVVDVRVSVDIDVNIPPSPVASTPGIAPGGTDSHTGSK
jgi:hypothetical protein